jgi:glutamine synthetase
MLTDLGMKPAVGKDGGGMTLGPKENYNDCVVAEYVWVDAHGVPRSKTKTLSKKPHSVEDLPMWNFDGSSTEQAAGDDSEIYIMPRAVFKDPFRGGENVMVLSECFTPEMKPAIGNTRAAAKEVMDKFADMDPWFGIEQEYTLMTGDQKVGLASDVPLGFNKDGSEPAEQGPYYCGAGTNVSIGRKVAEEHYAKCLYAGIKVAGINAEVMPGQWEYQVGPCKGMEMGDHLVMSRYIMLRVTEDLGVQVTFHPKPRHGDWNGAGCHTNFSTKEMREEGGLDVIYKVCEAFGAVSEKHVEVYGTDNDQRLTGKHETCSINEFKFGVADRGASIRIPRETWAKKKGYLEDRRPAANCDPYKVTARMMQTTGDCITGKGLDM